LPGRTDNYRNAVPAPKCLPERRSGTTTPLVLLRSTGVRVGGSRVHGAPNPVIGGGRCPPPAPPPMLGSSAPHQRITQPTSSPHVASPTWSSMERVARPATKRFHPSDWRPLEACCRPWTWWCNDATALAVRPATRRRYRLMSKAKVFFMPVCS